MYIRVYRDPDDFFSGRPAHYLEKQITYSRLVEEAIAHVGKASQV